MNDEFPPDSPKPGTPQPGEPGSIVPRHQPVWRPADEIEEQESTYSEELASEPLLSTPQKIDIETGDTYYDEPAYAEHLDEESRAAEYRHYGESLDTAYDDEPESEPLGGLSEAPSHEKELELMDHLRELRQRLLRSFAAIGLAMVLTWNLRDALLTWFGAPINKEVLAAGGKLITLNPTEGFMLYMQITFVAAVLLAIPIILYQLWAFVEPALTRKERRYGIVLVPFSVTLFFTGALLGYYMTPVFFRFFLQFQPPGTVPTWSYQESATLLGKMLLVFGICFQVPVISIFVNKIGIVSRNHMIEYWRHVVVVIFVVVAVITPSWDPVTMCAAATPPCILYGLSIWLVKWL